MYFRAREDQEKEYMGTSFPIELLRQPSPYLVDDTLFIKFEVTPV